MSLAVKKWNGRRGHFEIVLEVLKALRKKDLSLTHILIETYLNSQVLIPILEDLEKRFLVTHSTKVVKSRTYHTYHLTRLGFQVTEQYLAILHALQ